MNEINLNKNMNLIDKIEVSSGFNVIFIENGGIETNFISINFDYGFSDIRKNLNNKIVDYPVGTAHLLEHLVGNHKISAINRFMEKKYIYLPYTSFYHTGFTIQNYGKIYEPIKEILELLYSFQVNEIELNKEKKILLNEFSYLYESFPKKNYKKIYDYHPVRYELEGINENLDEIDAKRLYGCYMDNYLKNNKVVLIMKNHISQAEIAIVNELINNYKYNTIYDQRYIYQETKEVPVVSSIDENTLLLAFTSSAIQNAHDRIIMKLIFDEVIDFTLKLNDLAIDYETEFGIDFSYLLITFSKTIYTSELMHKINDILFEIKKFKLSDYNFSLLQKKIVSKIIRSLDDLIALNIDIVDAHFQEQNYLEILNEILSFTQEDYMKILKKIDFDIKLKKFIKERNM